MSWLSSIGQTHSSAELRDRLRRQVPQLDPHSLARVAIVGAAPEGQRLAAICRQRGIDLAAIVDDDPAKTGAVVEGATVAPSRELDGLDRTVPVVIASHRVLGATERLRAKGFACVWPFAYLQAVAPDMFAPHMFYTNWLEDIAENRDRYIALAPALADDKSRRVLDAVLGFRQTLDPLVLKPVLDADDLYAPRGLLDFTDDEVYIDGGSYDGDTIRTFIARVSNRFERVFGFEPDPQTYRRLCENFAHEPRVTPIPAGVFGHKGILRFKNDSTRGAIFSDEGDTEIAVTTIDEVLGEGRVSYIKMNIEGAEIDALRGAAGAIRRWRPKLAISVYHRPSDLWQIPDVVRNLCKDYELYLRQHDGGVIETVLYAKLRN